ncbi:MAG: aminodeoxychorismate synthase component I [Pseudomonadales bacterium]|nr:aminodeoxychorismate synthase component I [Pseudomonadales bacterium]
MSWTVERLPWSADPFDWFLRVRELPWPLMLESGGYEGHRYDLVAACPSVIIRTRDGSTTVTDGIETKASALSPFECVEHEVDRRRPAQPCPLDSPFKGGAIGWFGYELGHYVEKLPPAPGVATVPDMLVAIYDSFILIDHDLRSCHLVSAPGFPATHRQQFRNALGKPADRPTDNFRASPLHSNFSQQDYNGAIERIRHYIHEGDCYQVNLAQRFSAEFTGDPVSLFTRLRKLHRAPFSACLAFPDQQVLSYSPERFVRVRNGEVLTQPIKGTRPRGETPAADQALADSLRASEKDRAENLMIVDLLRNDLGRCCVPGSITVNELFELRSFHNVHHLVRSISGRLRDGVSAIELLQACFPGGSITGAPKIRAMEIINELEPDRREVYCGAIGYYDYEGNMDTNLAIRTMVCADNQLRFWGGGGIVADSTAASEYQESLDKVSMFRQALSSAPIEKRA